MTKTLKTVTSLKNTMRRDNRFLLFLSRISICFIFANVSNEIYDLKHLFPLQIYIFITR